MGCYILPPLKISSSKSYIPSLTNNSGYFDFFYLLASKMPPPLCDSSKEP